MYAGWYKVIKCLEKFAYCREVTPKWNMELQEFGSVVSKRSGLKNNWENCFLLLLHALQSEKLIWMFVSVLSEDNDFVTDGSPLSPYLWLPAMPGHFVRLPEEKGYTADLLQCNQTQRQSLELHDPGASFSHILQSSSCIWVWVRVRQMLGEEWVGVGGGEKSVKSYEIRPWIINNQINLFSVQEEQADYRGMCGVGGHWVCFQLHISDKHTTATVPERRDGQEGWDWGEGQQHVFFYSLSFLPSFS